MNQDKHQDRNSNYKDKIFEFEKQKIIARNLTADKYEREIRKLCERLEI